MASEDDNALLLEQAKILAEEMLLRRHSNGQVVRLLMKQYPVMTASAARRVIEDLARDWREAAEPARQERRNQQRVVLHNLYARAFAEKKYSTCLGVERLLADLDGTLAPKRFVDIPAGRGIGKDDEFEGKSEAECDFFATYGRWPDEQRGEAH